MDSHRTHEVYGLRQVVKRKRFTDEISEPSDLDLDDDDEDILAGDDSADEYNPDEVEQTMLEEDSDTEGDLEEDDLIEDDLESTPNEEEEGLSSLSEINYFITTIQTFFLFIWSRL
jgi:hypothetical protein